MLVRFIDNSRYLAKYILPSYMVCSQIFLNVFLYDHHLGYIKNLAKKTLLMSIAILM
jgi:hypothetical protein